VSSDMMTECRIAMGQTPWRKRLEAVPLRASVSRSQGQTGGLFHAGGWADEHRGGVLEWEEEMYEE
jgi:hypothetical protein